MDLSILIPPAIGALRSISGWLENALEDGKITLIEWRQLGSTIIRISVYSFGILFGFNVDVVTASALGVLLDIAIVKIYNF